MHKSFPRFAPSSLRKPVTMLVAYLMLVTPLAPVFAQTAKVKRAQLPASAAPVTQSPSQGGSTTGSVKSLTLSAPNIVATKTDNLSQSTQVAPGGTINYTVTITNNGNADATGVVFNDTVDTNTTVNASSAVLAADDDYNTIGNVNISVAAPGLLANDLDIDAGNNTGMTTTAETKSSASCVGCNNVTINGDGSFTYDPPVGFNGTDLFTYTAHTTGGKTATATAHILVSGRIWFVNNSAASCTSAGCGRLSNPFTDLASFQAINDNAATLTHAKTGDSIFIYQSLTAYTGPVTLLSTQKLVGQDATTDLLTITGLTAPSGTSQLPVMDTGGTTVVINSTNANGVTLGSGNTIRGLTVNNVGTGTKISGTSFGTLTVGNSSSPDVTLSGTGQALNLSTGAFAATSGFVGVATTSSGGQGINLDTVTGAASFGSTTVSGSTTQCILIGHTTADINFGNTSCTGGTDGISFQNNATASGHGFTFGTLGVSGSTGIAFVHAVGGGNVTVTGAATLSSASNAIDIQSMTASTAVNFQSSVSATPTGATATGVNLVGNTNASITFNSLTVQTAGGTGLNATGGGTVNVTNGTGTINNTTRTAPAIVASGIALNANFSSINSSGGTNGVSLTSVTGTSNFGTGTLSGASGATFNVSGGTATVTYSGNITQANNAAAVSVSGGHNTGTLTFQTGTISATNGTGLQFDNADGTYNFNGTTTLNGGGAAISITNGSDGAFSFSSNTSVTNPSGAAAFNVSGGTGSITYNGTLSQNTAQRVINVGTHTGGTVAFSGAVSASGTSTGVLLTNNAGATINFTGGLSLSTGANDAFTATGAGPAATTGGTINVTQNNTSIINTLTTTTGTALKVQNATIGASGITFRSISATGSSNSAGIILDNTGSTAGLTVSGNAGTCTQVNSASCSGGTINNKTGADINTVNTDGTAAISGTNGVGIFLRSTKSPSFAFMHLHDFSNYAVIGASVTGLSMNNVVIDGTNGDNENVDEGSMRVDNLTVSSSITNTTIQGAREDNLRITNTGGTLNRAVFDNLTVGLNDTTVGDDGILIQAREDAVVNATIQNSHLNGARGDMLQFDLADACDGKNPSGDLVLTNDQIINGHSATVVGGGGVTLSGGGCATSNVSLTYGITGSTFRGARGDALLLALQTGGGSFSGTISGNTFGASGTDKSGSSEASDIEVRTAGRGSQTVKIDSNSIFQYSNFGILLQTGNINTGGSTGTVGSMQATVTNNTVSNPSSFVFNKNGIQLNSGTNTGDNYSNCVDIKTNTAAGSGGGSPTGDIQLRNRILTTVKLPGYGGANNDNAAVAAFISGQNVGSPTVVVSNDVSGGGGGYVGGGACTAAATSMVSPDGTTPPPALSSAARQQGTPSNDITAQPFVSLPVAPVAKPAKGSAQAAASAQLSAPAASAQQPPVSKSGAADKSGSSKSSTRPVVVLSSTAVSANIGTLKAGDSVQINFSVTVTNSVPNGVTTVSNQGSVTGANFTTVNGKTGTPNTDDPDNPGAPGSPNPTVTQLLTPPDIRANDAKVAEPALGQQTTMLFVVTLNHAYPPTGVTVNYATANGGASPAVGGASCDGSTDYITTSSNTLSFGATETVKTVPVTVCGTGIASDKTLLLNLSGASAGNIVDAQAVGTITAANAPGTLLISEVRTSGPAGAGDQFVELYNNTTSPMTVAASDASAGYGLFKMGVDCTVAPVLVATVPSGTVIPARGHYLLVGSQYSLKDYGGTNAALGNQTLTSDIENDRNVAVFTTADPRALSTAARLDAVGFGTNTGNTCDLLREGATLPAVAAALGATPPNYSYFRNLSTGLPADTNDNLSDFLFADVADTSVLGMERLGAPGPENLASPINRASTIKPTLFDTGVSSSAVPNRDRSATVVTNGANGTLVIRRTFTNNTGGTVTKLRFRVVDMTAGAGGGPGTADLRLLDTTAGSTSLSGGGTKSWVAMTLETPPAQAKGGGTNSSIIATLPGGGLTGGNSINVQFTLGVQQPGNFRFFVVVEGLP